MINDKIYVTQPSLPCVKEYKECIDKIWENKWLTNNGEYHQEFEAKLKEYLNVDYLTLVSNGTFALLLALKALNIKGEIITTPFTFVATTSIIEWLGCIPVFCDINENDYNIDSNKIEALITPNTVAVMPVHIFGFPCDNEKISKIITKYNLRLIYDAAHTFNVIEDGKEVLNYGDFSTLSFHATKAFNTIEGGAIISHTKEDKAILDQLRNFGYDANDNITLSGINCKMNELQSAYGLLQLTKTPIQIDNRKKLFMRYLKNLQDVKGIKLPILDNHTEYNYSYFPIRVTQEYKITRDELFIKLEERNIFSRKYFFPLVSNMIPFADTESAKPLKLPIANLVADEILCLPLFEELSFSNQDRVINELKTQNV